METGRTERRSGRPAMQACRLLGLSRDAYLGGWLEGAVSGFLLLARGNDSTAEARRALAEILRLGDGYAGRDPEFARVRSALLMTIRSALRGAVNPRSPHTR